MKNPCSLKKNELFLRAYKKGNRVHHRLLVIHFYPNGLGFNRLGIKVGKKIAGAVGRNRIKRLIREAYRLKSAELFAGYDIVVVAKEGASGVSGLCEVSDALTLLFSRAGLKKAENKNNGAKATQR